MSAGVRAIPDPRERNRIKLLYAAGLQSTHTLAERYGVAFSTIADIVAGITPRNRGKHTKPGLAAIARTSRRMHASRKEMKDAKDSYRLPFRRESPQLDQIRDHLSEWGIER